MLRFRHVLAAMVVLGVLGSGANSETKGDPKVLIEDTATRQAQLKRAYEAFRQKLAVMAGRYEASDSEKDRARGKALRRVLKAASERSVEFKFDALIAALNAKDADKNVDVLGQIVRDNKELRQDLRVLLDLFLEGEGKRLAKLREDAAALLAKLKELRDKQARLQAQVERGKKKNKDLEKLQQKITKDTKDVLPKEPGSPDKPVEMVRKPVEDAIREQGKAEKQLGQNQGDSASESQGRAVAKLDEAIRRLQDLLRQTRKEERERIIADLLARCKKMLSLQLAIRDGTEQLARDIRKTADKVTVAHGARANKLADRQEVSLKEADAVIKMIKEEGEAVVFAEVFEQIHQDMRVLKYRLMQVDVGPVTQAIENDLVETLQEVIRALEKAKDEEMEPGSPGPGGDGPSKKPKLVNLLQQLKMIFALQRRVRDRTALYGKRYKGEQAPLPAKAATAAERQRFENIQKELAELAARQDRIGKVTREVSKQDEARRID